jgi:hypothetical protein
MPARLFDLINPLVRANNHKVSVPQAGRRKTAGSSKLCARIVQASRNFGLLFDLATDLVRNSTQPRSKELTRACETSGLHPHGLFLLYPTPEIYLEDDKSRLGQELLVGNA